MSYAGLPVLVTGADGFIGSHLVEILVQRGAAVTALSCYNSFDKYGWLDDLPDTIRRDVRMIRGDVRDAAQVRALVRGQTIIFHLAALISIPHSYVAAQSYVDTNVSGTLNVLDAAREFGAQRIVLTSTSEVYGTAITQPIAEDHPLQGQSPYAASKIGADMMAEAFAKSFDLPAVILRPFNTFGPRQSERAIIPTIIRQALDARCSTIRVGDTTTKRDLTFVQDTAEAFAAIGVAPSIEFGTAYNAGSGKSASIGELIKLIASLADADKPIVRDSCRMRPPNSEVRILLSDSSRLWEATGWKPKVPLREGLMQTIEWWSKRLTDGQVRREHHFMS